MCDRGQCEQVFTFSVAWTLEPQVSSATARERGGQIIGYAAELLAMAPPAAGLEERLGELTAQLGQQHWIPSAFRRARVRCDTNNTTRK
jgi:hypothetical protein